MAMSEQECEVFLTICNCMVKGYHKCLFNVKVGEKFGIRKKKGERGNALRVVNDRGQLGHLKSELVAPLWPLESNISV